MLAILAGAFAVAAGPIHCISDISQEFSFYMDGRFARQYLTDTDRDARNWGTLWKLDLSNTNLLVLAGGDRRVPYHQDSLSHIMRYVAGGGGLLMMADAGPDGAELSKVARQFGASFSPERAEGEPVGIGELADRPITLRRGGTLEVGPDWTPLVRDEKGQILLARKGYGKGHVLISVRGLFGSNPDASDAINREWITPLLRQIASGKTVDPSQPHRGQFAELTREIGPLTLEFHEGTEPFADAISREYAEIRPHLVAVTSVEPSPGMITKLLILPTGSGGFSSGERIAIGAWWGDYPKNRYPMVELIAHEAGHSWVLPHPEPVWNEPIATYLGILVGRRMNMPEADRTLVEAIARARKQDPDMRTIDIGKPDAPNDVVWGKTYFLFEEIERLHGPGTLGAYFRAKRRLVPADAPSYSLDDSVAVWSAAVGQDLFPWFRSHGIDVRAERSRIGR
jgi:hypothetical protein